MNTMEFAGTDRANEVSRRRTMSEIKKSIPGTLKISEDVIASIVKNSVGEIEGVYSILPARKSVKQFFLKEEQSGDIGISLNEDVVEITLKIIVRGGFKAVSVAEEVQNNVKNAVQSMTGITVSRVNVIVAEIVFE